MRWSSVWIAAVLIGGMGFGAVVAEDNTLSPQEKADGWELLFNGKDYTGWKNNNGKPIASAIEDGCLVPYKAGGYLIVYDKPFGDFILRCDVRSEKEDANSGVFLRIGNLKNPVYTGLEVQVYAGGTGLHSFGSIYDLVPPDKNVVRPAGEWNQMEIACQGPRITVSVNGEQVAAMNADEFAERGKRPDGSRHKFLGAIKDFPRSGYLGFQDHGDKVWFKNVRIKNLDSSKTDA